jgi:hypothetical protein
VTGRKPQRPHKAWIFQRGSQQLEFDECRMAFEQAVDRGNLEVANPPALETEHA